ncbi:hypothetical protein KCV03_g61, partial [Aureobasidium melanogenum]
MQPTAVAQPASRFNVQLSQSFDLSNTNRSSQVDVPAVPAVVQGVFTSVGARTSVRLHIQGLQWIAGITKVKIGKLQLSSKICRQILENLRSQAIWFSDHCGFTAICIFTDARMKRYIGEKLDVHLIALLDDTFATENGMCGRAVRTCECGHVLDHTKNLYTMSGGVSGKTNNRCRTGTLTFRNISTPRTASLSATSCGVDTMTAPRTCQHVGNMSAERRRYLAEDQGRGHRVHPTRLHATVTSIHNSSGLRMLRIGEEYWLIVSVHFLRDQVKSGLKGRKSRRSSLSDAKVQTRHG